MRIALLSLLLLFVLSGCAVNTIQNTRISANEPLKAGHGAVVVQVVNNTDRLGTFHQGWTEVIAFRTDNIDEIKANAIALAKEKAKSKKEKFDPEKVDWEPEFYSLTPVNQGTIDSQLFVGSMPEGKYMISTLYSFFSNGDMSSWLTMPVMFSAGRFSVGANNVSDLGTVVFQPLLSIKEKSFWSNSSQSKAFVTRVEEKQKLSDFVLSHYPAIASSLKTDITLGWEDDGLDSFRGKLSELSRQNAYSSQALRLDGYGVGALASKFGQLRVLFNDGNWKQLDLPTNSRISAVFESEQGLHIGGERGQLFSLVNGDWQVSQPVPPREAIVWFGKGSETNFALTSSAKQYSAYTFDQITQQWKRMGAFTRKDPNDWLVQNGGLFPFITQSGGLRILNDNKILDYNGDTWVTKKGESTRSVAQLENNVLVGVEVSQWDGVGDQVISFDDGDSWTSIWRRLNLFDDSKTDVSLPGYTSTAGVITVGRVKGRNQTKASDLKILTAPVESSDDRNGWTAHGDAKDGCYSFLPQLTREDVLYFLCDQGQIVSTADFGKTWKTEIDVDLSSMTATYEQFVDELVKQAEKEEAEAASDTAEEE